MAEATTPVSIRDNVGAALRFVRENWRFVLTVAAITAPLQGAAFLFMGATLSGLLLIGLITAVSYAALTRAALFGVGGAQQHLAGDGGRVFAAVAAIGFFLSIVFIMLLFVAMSVLIAPFEAEVKAAGEDQAALIAIMDRAVAAQPGTLGWTIAIGLALVFVITSRFYVAAPGCVDQKRVFVFESWKWTRGNFLRVMGARLMLLLPALILVWALQSLAGAALGAPAGDPAAVAAYAAANPAPFATFYAVASFLQIVIYSALEAGLSANLYRSLKPPAA
jgi:hypothetical protein